MLQSAREAEAADYLEGQQKTVDDETGRRKVVGKGHQPERTIQSGLGRYPGKEITRSRRQERKLQSTGVHATS